MSRWRRISHSEGALWFLAFLLAVVGHVAAHGVVEAIAGHPPPYWIRWTLGFLALTVCFYSLYRSPLSALVPGARRWVVFVREGSPWVIGAAAGVPTFGLAVALRGAGTTEGVSWSGAAGYGAALLGLGYALYVKREEVLALHTRELHQEDITAGAKGRRSHIVWLLAPVTRELASRQGRPKCFPDDVEDGTETLESAFAALEAAEEHWNWEPLMRGVRPHTKRGEHVVLTLVCSEQSLKESGWAAAILKRFGEFSNVDVRVWATAVEGTGPMRFVMADAADQDLLDEAKRHGIQFSSVDALAVALSALLKYIRTVDKVVSEMITVDFTGGQKPASLVAGAVTFRSEVKTQYVDTTGDKRVFEYDVVIDPDPKGA